MGSLVQRLLAGPRQVRVLLYMLVDAALAAFAVWLAFVLRLEGRWDEYLAEVPWIYPVAILATVVSFQRFGLYRSPLRFATGAILYRVVKGATVSSLVIVAAVFLIPDGVVPRGAIVILWGLLVALPGIARMVIRDTVRYYAKASRRAPVAIYGAGTAGHQLATALLYGSEFQPVAFIDDAPNKQGQTIAGLVVHEPGYLETLVEERGVREVLVAIPAASRARHREVINLLSAYSVTVRVVPSVEDIAAGRKKVDELRRIEIADILGREEVSAMPQLLSRAVAGRSVLVTGAGGSIGSELCREIFKQKAACLVMVENSEFALYSISRELEELRAATNTSIELVSVLASACDRDRVFRTMRKHGTQVVFHAAAYKHVPIVEINAVEGVRNNVFATLQCALAARDAGVGKFVLVSTDKAVRPSNVMGATK